MSTTQLPDVKEKAAEISRKIANTRPPERDKNAPEGQVTGGFNQKRDQGTSRPDSDENSATEGDGQ